MKFEFATAGRVVFGAGTLSQLGEISAELGKRALVLTGRDASRCERSLELLQGAGLSVTQFTVAAEPSLVLVQQAVLAGLEAHCDLVISVGGGSALDAGKAAAALLYNRGDILDYLEVIGRGQPLRKPSAPFIAVPTTAGTGSEATRNAVLSSPDHKVKVSLRSPYMLPAVALVDPELTLGLPAALTASTGLDALTQLIEPFTSCRANPMVDALCRQGIPLVARSLERACQDGNNLAARADMSLASLLGGMALANAGLGAVHGFAGPLGGMFPAPHGAVCAALLPHVMLANYEALLDRSPDHPALGRYAEVARMLTGSAQAQAEAGIQWVRDLVQRLGVPSLRAYGISAEHFPAIILHSSRASSMKANPLPLTENELAGILRAASL